MINYTYPVVTTGVTLTELPDKISLFIEMGQCYNNCKGCHSDHLRCGVADKTSLQSIVYTVHNEIYKGAPADFTVEDTAFLAEIILKGIK